MSLETAGGRLVPVIHSEYESQNLELNDNVKWGNWSFNLGLLLSNDTLYRAGPARGERQRVGLRRRARPQVRDVRDRLGRDDLAAAGGHLGLQRPRHGLRQRGALLPGRQLAASRRFLGPQPGGHSPGRLRRRTATSSPRRPSPPPPASSSTTTSTRARRRVSSSARRGRSTPRWTARAYGRYRYGANFWEDTNNDARQRFEPPAGIPRELYIPNLATVRAEIGGSSYVIAELDGAFTKYYEASLESEWRGEQDLRPRLLRLEPLLRQLRPGQHHHRERPSTSSSALRSSATAPARQLWDKRYGDLRGDRRHQLKLYGYYQLPWHATVGGFAVYQSGQPWEAWDFTIVPASPRPPHHRRHQPLRRAGGVAHHRRPLPARPQLHPGLPVRSTLQRAAARSTCSTSSTSRRGTTSRTR